MGTKRPVATGAIDALGRQISVSDQQAARSVTAPPPSDDMFDSGSVEAWQTRIDAMEPLSTQPQYVLVIEDPDTGPDTELFTKMGVGGKPPALAVGR